ncbi:hypothetical protein KIL84_015137 [Mauremys mutica]|uniref:Uncharacterized protein n=1 Tax=Mauremys mutica TaxID=74926 RepID=A0A9D3XY75_9SAUR|nr:hypothetical protein KIL84_015137 [Mauremys mutica]
MHHCDFWRLLLRGRPGRPPEARGKRLSKNQGGRETQTHSRSEGGGFSPTREGSELVEKQDKEVTRSPSRIAFGLARGKPDSGRAPSSGPQRPGNSTEVEAEADVTVGPSPSREAAPRSGDRVKVVKMTAKGATKDRGVALVLTGLAATVSVLFLAGGALLAHTAACEGRSLLKTFVAASAHRGESVHVFGFEIPEEEFRAGFDPAVTVRPRRRRRLAAPWPGPGAKLAELGRAGGGGGAGAGAGMMRTQCLLGLRSFVAFATKLWSFLLYLLRRQVRTRLEMSSSVLCVEYFHPGFRSPVWKTPEGIRAAPYNPGKEPLKGSGLRGVRIQLMCLPVASLENGFAVPQFPYLETGDKCSSAVRSEVPRGRAW